MSELHLPGVVTATQLRKLEAARHAVKEAKELLQLGRAADELEYESVLPQLRYACTPGSVALYLVGAERTGVATYEQTLLARVYTVGRRPSMTETAAVDRRIPDAAWVQLREAISYVMGGSRGTAWTYGVDVSLPVSGSAIIPICDHWGRGFGIERTAELFDDVVG